MTVLSKIVYYLSLSIITGYVLLALVLSFTRVEFRNDRDADFFNQVILVGIIPLAISLTAFKAGFQPTWDKSKRRRFVIGRVLASVFAFILLFIFSFLSMWSKMCAWSTEDVLFEKKNNRSTIIAKRAYGCGATDSGYPTFAIFKIRNFTPFFTYANRIDTNRLKKEEWVRVNKE